MFVSAALLASCAGAEPVATRDAEGKQTILSAASDLAGVLAETRLLLQARIDTSRLHLGPIAQVTEAAPFDPEALEAALLVATGSTFEGSWAGATWNASSETHQVSLDTETGTLLVADAGDYERGLTQAEDAVFLAQANALFTALAADAAVALTEVKHLGVTSHSPEDGADAEPTRLGTKVFAFRKLGGLRVAGDRLVASYKTDGTLRTVRGRWPSIDLVNSQLTATLSQEEIVAQALDVLLAANVRGAGTDSIVLESFYELREGPNGQHVAVLRASALVQTRNADGEPGRGERHDFDI